MYSGASNTVEGVDNAFLLIFGISAIFFVAITVAMLWFIFKYHRKRNAKAIQVKENTTLEVAWTIIPLILVLIMFWVGYKGFLVMRNAPDDAMIVKATGYMWDWEFEYQDGKKSKELVMPVNKPIKLEMTSRDVIHSLYIPAFRIKEDMVPGQQTYTWFIPQQVDTFQVYCAEYCGLRHSYMLTKAIVLEEADYDEWLASIPAASEVKEHPGMVIMRNNGCLGCHSMDGSQLVGTTFKGLWGSKKIVITDGKEREITVDETYIKESITEPKKDLVKGFQPLMQAYDKILTEEQIDTIVDYFETAD